MTERKQSFNGEVPKKARQAVCAFANDLPNHNKPGVTDYRNPNIGDVLTCAGVIHYFFWQMKQPPAYCCDPVVLPIATQNRMLEQYEQVISDYADAKKGDIASNCLQDMRFIPRPIFNSSARCMMVQLC